MLDIDAGSVAAAPDSMQSLVWAELPESLEDFFEFIGPMPLAYEEKRAYARHYLRTKATLRHGDNVYGGYCSDVSRDGICVVSPVQFLPLEKITIELTADKKIRGTVRRCRRIEQRCYSIGCQINVGE